MCRTAPFDVNFSLTEPRSAQAYTRTRSRHRQPAPGTVHDRTAVPESAAAEDASETRAMKSRPPSRVGSVSRPSPRRARSAGPGARPPSRLPASAPCGWATSPSTGIRRSCWTVVGCRPRTTSWPLPAGYVPVAGTGLRPPRCERLPCRCCQPGARPGMRKKVDLARHRRRSRAWGCRGGLAAAGATTRHVRSGPTQPGSHPAGRVRPARRHRFPSVAPPSAGADHCTGCRPRLVGGASGGGLGVRSRLSASRRGVCAPAASGTARGRWSAPERSAGAGCRPHQRSVQGRLS